MRSCGAFGAAALGLLLLVLPASLEAQSITSPYRHIETRYTVGAFAGYLGTSRGDLGLGPHSAPIFGARFNILFSGPLSGELAVSYSPSQRSLVIRPGLSPATPLVTIGETDLALAIAEAGLRFNLTGSRTWNGFAPYAALGGGIAFDLTGISQQEAALPPEQHFDFGPAFAGALALGTDFFVHEQLSVRLDLRGYLWRLGQPGGLTQTGEPANEWRPNVNVNLGGAFHF